ncbi:hypothetical protein GFY24_13325 [Nocardia sp. SYP-A9097]|uniref:hypothetical protein n=1 Tax=Nocardia sp. SYP-A9097 TaxID=2663237 RepID=UPI00129A7FDD|nr:hypothetical protein [Nocardia sp. SYP-A9097]MRH88414.1 hypothetical protein [Nocardia sp. SYP-A9097]
MAVQGPEERTPERVSIAGWIARAIAVVIFIPLRLLWEGCKLFGRGVVAVLEFISEKLLEPLVKLFRYWVVRPIWAFFTDFLWGLILQQLLWGMILTPLGAFLLDFLLRPLKRAVEEWLWRRVLKPSLIWFGRKIIEPIANWIARWILVPIAQATMYVLYFIGRWLIAWPLTRLWRWALWPILSVLGAALLFGWRVATTIVRVLVVTPCRWLYRTALQPLFAIVATVWRATVVRPVRFVYLRVLTPMNKAAAELMTSLFGH